MISSLSSPAKLPAPDLGFSEAARALRPTVSDIIWNLHCIIVNPNSKLDEVRTAKRRLLRLFKTSKFQEMIVPPLDPPGRANRQSDGCDKPARVHGIVQALLSPCLSRRGEGARPSALERPRKLLTERPH